jgi:hypothetical protein
MVCSVPWFAMWRLNAHAATTETTLAGIPHMNRRTSANFCAFLAVWQGDSPNKLNSGRSRSGHADLNRALWKNRWLEIGCAHSTVDN